MAEPYVKRANCPTRSRVSLKPNKNRACSSRSWPAVPDCSCLARMSSNSRTRITGSSMPHSRTMMAARRASLSVLRAMLTQGRKISMKGLEAMPKNLGLNNTRDSKERTIFQIITRPEHGLANLSWTKSRSSVKVSRKSWPLWVLTDVIACILAYAWDCEKLSIYIIGEVEQNSKFGQESITPPDGE